MIIEYAACPGNKYGFTEGCDSIVAVQEGDRINFCCVACFNTTWEPTQFFLNGDEDYVPVDYGHSAQCLARQESRRGLPVVTDRQFAIAGRVPNVPAK